MIYFLWGALGLSGIFWGIWTCATLHEIHLDMKRIGDILRDKQLEIPNPLMVERYENR